MTLKVRTENPVSLPLVIYFILFLAKKLGLKNIGVVNTTLTTPAPTPLLTVMLVLGLGLDP